MIDKKTNRMLVEVILDRSGSMLRTRAGTVSGYNEYINGLKSDKESEYFVSLIQFDAHGSRSGPELTITYEDRPLAEVPELTLADYEPRGNTPLYDAIGECVRRIDAKDRAVTVAIITDGENNASVEFTQESAQALVKQKEAEGWVFVFMGANIDAYSAGGAVGMSAMNTSNYAQGRESELFSNLAQSTIARSTLCSTQGVHAASMSAFYSDDQRKQMGDFTVPQQPFGTAPGVATGGQMPGPATFRPHIGTTGGHVPGSINIPNLTIPPAAPKTTKPTSAKVGSDKKPRKWAETRLTK